MEDQLGEENLFDANENKPGKLLLKLKKGFKSYKYLNKKAVKYTYLIMLLGLGYEFFSNRALSNRVNELQGKVDNLYQKVNESKKDNEVLNRK